MDHAVNGPTVRSEKSKHECDNGFVLVDDAYLDRVAPLPGPDADEATSAQMIERRRSMTNSVYPCAKCRPELFTRWAGEHFAPDHECPSCPRDPYKSTTPKRVTE